MDNVKTMNNLYKQIWKKLSTRKNEKMIKSTSMQRNHSTRLSAKLSKTFLTQKRVIYQCETTVTILGECPKGKKNILSSWNRSLIVPRNEDNTYRPTLAETYNARIKLKSKDGVTCNHQINLIDTCCSISKYLKTYCDTLRRSEAFIIVFSLEDKNTLNSARRFIDDIDSLKRNSNTPLLVIGLANETHANVETKQNFFQDFNNVNRVLYFEKSISFEEDDCDSLVCLLKDIEKRKGIERHNEDVKIL